MDILLDKDTTDIPIGAITGKADAFTESIAQAVEQRLTITLNTFIGEWFLDTAAGTPYFQEIFRKVQDTSIADAAFRDIIEADPQVVQITFFESNLSETREYSLQFSVRATDGSETAIITVNPLA